MRSFGGHLRATPTLSRDAVGCNESNFFFSYGWRRYCQLMDSTREIRDVNKREGLGLALAGYCLIISSSCIVGLEWDDVILYLLSKIELYLIDHQQDNNLQNNEVQHQNEQQQHMHR